MTEIIIGHIEWAVQYAHVWGFLMVFLFMTIESSFIPFPSEVVLIPAGFMAYRGELFFGDPLIDIAFVFVCGLAGSLAGAYINYYLALYLGRPFLYRYGKYLFLKPMVLARSEEIFLKYGEIATFVCRLLPAIRQLISIPAGISKMPLSRFSSFTALGAGIWSIILIWVGYYLGRLSGNMTYRDLVYRGKEMIAENYVWILCFIAVVIFAYLFIHRLIMKSDKNNKTFS
jgi:membrane protein DedA with SNARE-associated domain